MTLAFSEPVQAGDGCVRVGSRFCSAKTGSCATVCQGPALAGTQARIQRSLLRIEAALKGTQQVALEDDCVRPTGHESSVRAE